MKHSILLIIATIFSLQTITISAIDSERTGKAVVMLVGEIIESSQDISETKQVIDKKERRKQRIAHIAKIIKAVTLAIIEIIAASKHGKIQFTRSGEINQDGTLLQQEVEAHLRLILSEMLDELDEIEQEEAADEVAL